MGEIIELNTGDIMPSCDENSLMEITEGLMQDVRNSLADKNVMSVPIAKLSTLGAGVSSLIPAFNTVTQSTSIAADGLYRVANAGIGDALKAAQGGKFWGALKTAEGGSKMAQLEAAGSMSVTSKAVSAFNPATMMMAVALFSIEQELGNIEEMQKQILSFLEIEKESEIEADVETLTSIIQKYKMNWDNEHYTSSNHKLVIDIQRTARKNMLSFQKKVEEVIEKKQIVVAQSKVKQAHDDLEKKFKYYRLALYNFSLASLMEIMLSGNFKEEYIARVRAEIMTLADKYRETFEKGSLYLERLGNSELEANLLKGAGAAGKAIGEFIGAIPLIKDGSVDENLQESGAKLKMKAAGMKKKAVYDFSLLSNPGTKVFVDKMNDMIQIYNHTEKICFDNKQIYLIA